MSLDWRNCGSLCVVQYVEQNYAVSAQSIGDMISPKLPFGVLF